MDILFASNNQGKLTEVKSILADLPITLRSPTEFPQSDSLEVAETAKTLNGNALLKAKTFAELTGLVTIADDTGLKIKALHGFPGVNSHRWFEGNDSERNQALLRKTKDLKKRQASFVTVICLYDPKKAEAKYFQGEMSGKISKQELGSEGFGYDAIFIPEGYQKTLAQMGLKIKNKLSHRAKALRKLKDYLAAN
ncbi:MAG: RdgB/HAM1 family non-canonical purine NTP pyrophosphatase [Candidatus Woesebacteria bacterium]